ncbi:MAG: PAS domain-containing sensor histidine kinase [Candidatus Hodarchaeales archaeon]
MENKYRELVESHNRLKAELRDIRELNEQFVALFKAAVFEIDLTTPRIIYANDVALELTEYSLEELKAMNPYDILYESDKHDYIERVQKILAGDSVPARMEYKIVSKSGKIKWLASNERLVKTGDSKYPNKAVIVVMDITEQKETIDALKKSEDKYRALFDSRSDAMFVMKGDRFIYCNDRTLEMFKCQRHDIIGESPYNFSPERQPDGRYSYEKALEKIKKAQLGETQYFEWVHRRLNGEEFYTQVTLNRLEFDTEAILAIVRETTEQKYLEHAFKESEEKYRTLVESLLEWVWEIDTNAIFTFSSPRVKRIIGIGPEDMIGRSLFDFMVETEAEKIRKKIFSIFSDERSFDSLELTLLNKYGAQVVLDCSGVPIFDDKGILIGYRGASRDITARKRSEEQYRSIWDFAPFGLLSFHLLNDGSLILTGTNHACDQILGINGEKLIGQMLENAFPELIHTEIPEAFRRVAKDGIKWMDNHFALQHDHNPNQIAFSGVFEFYAFQTQPMQMVAAILDISERAISEMKLQESEQRFRRLITNMSEGIWVTDKNNITIFINPALEKILGYSSHEILHKNVINFLAEESISDFLKYSFQRIKHKHLLDSYELTFLRKNGEKVICRVSASELLDSDNQLAGSFAVISDITTERKAEEARRDLERRRAEFISMSSHELRTPLSIIMGYFELLKKRIDNISQEELDKSFIIIQKNIRRLLRLIAGVSDLTKIERGIFNLNFELVNVVSFLEEHLGTYKDILGPQFKYENNIGLTAFANLDTDRISQVIDNIIENAINNSCDDTRLITVTSSQDNPSYIKIIIKDNGAGINPEYLEEIFEAFVTRPTKYSKKVSGTGIGLYLSKVIIEQHGGYIEAFSEGLDKGAQFTIILPIVEM